MALKKREKIEKNVKMKAVKLNNSNVYNEERV